MAEIDCDNRTHLCHAICCIVGEVRDDNDNLVHRDGERCPHLTDDLQCAIYEDRPTVCRTFDCRSKCSIWCDYERYIPNPDLKDRL